MQANNSSRLFDVFVAAVTEYETATGIREKGTEKKEKKITTGRSRISPRSARSRRNSTPIAASILKRVAARPCSEVTLGSVIRSLARGVSTGSSYGAL